LGSVIALTDSTGKVVEAYKYDVYRRVNNTSSVGNPYLFTGRCWDKETGLYYYRARYYNSAIGRFMQTDPVGYSAGVNWYLYCGNNPVVLIDPWGLCGYNYRSALTGEWSRYKRDVGNYYKSIATAPMDYYSKFREAGLGPVSAALQSANMSVGKVVGYSNILEGAMGWDLRSAQGLSTGESWFRAGIGVVQTATFAVGAANSINAASSSVGPTTVSRWESASEDSGWVMKGEASPSNYFRSGKWDPNPTNTFASPSSGHQFTVPGESLSYPSGIDWWKGLIGQRIYTNPG
jgi:RHS repeat-associated protein